MMKIATIKRGAGMGALLGLIYFVADLVGTFAAIPTLFDPTFDGVMLLLIACGVSITLGAIIFGVMAGFCPLNLRHRCSPRLLVGIIGCIAATVAIGGYINRAGRHVAELGKHGPVTAQAPAPVLWVVIDTLRADTLYGPKLDFPLAPNLRRLAKSALVFTDAESTAGWTIPAMATLMTGIHSTTMDASAGFLPDWAPTLAEHLRAAGYQTDAVVDNVIVEPRNGFAAGFDSFFERSGFRFAFSLPAFRVLPARWREGLRDFFKTAYYGSKGVTRVAIERLNDHTDQRPQLLYVHYMDPHAPYYAHPELGADPEDAENVNYYVMRDHTKRGQGPLPTQGQMRLLRHRYGQEIRAVDRDLGLLLEAWQHRYGDRGLIVITADHGEEFLDHGHLGHGLTVHRELVHVPLMVALPKGLEAAPRVIATPTAHIDLLPTVLDVLDITPETSENSPAVQGISLLQWWQGRGAAPARPLMASHSRHGRRTYRYREGNLVYIKSMFYDGRKTERSLYDLEQDPTEQKNLIAGHPKAASMTANMQKLAGFLWKSFDPTEPIVSRANEESLRAMGYIQ